MPFQDMTSWLSRDPLYGGGAKKSASPAALKALKGVGPNVTPYGEDEQELAFQQQHAALEQGQQDWAAGPVFDRTRGGYQRNPANIRSQFEAGAGGPTWARFAEAMQRQQLMAGNRGMKSRIDLVGEGPGSGTGIGRWNAQVGSAGPGASFRSQGPDIDLDTLASDSQMAAQPRDRSRALQALQLISRGGR